MTKPFERAFTQAAGPMPTLCETCGGPKGRRERLIRFGNDPMLTCPDCNRSVDKDGRATGSFQGPFFVHHSIKLNDGEPTKNPTD